MNLTALFTLYRIAHQIRNDSAFVLALKDRVKRILDVLWNAEIDGGHRESYVVENFNNIVVKKA